MTECIATFLAAIAGGLIGIIGTLYGTREARTTALEAIRISEFNKEKFVFYKAFHKTLMALESQNLTMTETNDIVKKDIEKQIAAIQRFKFQINKTERANFLAKWEAYEHDCRAAKFADDIDNSRSHRKKANNLALHRLYSILKFADYERDEDAQQ